MKTIAILFIPCFLFADCKTSDALVQIAPGAEWSLRGDDYKNIDWVDQKTDKPTEKQVSDAVKKCNADQKAKETTRASAKAVLGNPLATADQKVNAVILLLDLDK